MTIERIPAGTDLQAALETAATSPGPTTLDLEAGATWEGVFEAPENLSGSPIRLMGAATLVSSGTSQPPLKARPKASHWHLISEPGKPLTLRTKGVSDTLRIGQGANKDGTGGQTLEDMPVGWQVRWCRLEGDETLGAQRGISLQCGEAVITHNTLVNIRARGVEAQGICGWNGTGPWLIEHNDIEAGGMPFMAGGGPTNIPDVVPTGITFRHNYCHRRPEWQDQPYSCKNFFEIKNGRDVLCEDNLFEYMWEQGQRYAVALTPRVSDTTFWAMVKGVRIRRNRFVHCPGGVNILGSDTNNAGSTGRAEDILIEDNEFLDIDTSKWGGHGSLLQLVRGNLTEDGTYAVPTNIIVRRNLAEQVVNGNLLWVESGPKTNRTPIPGLVLTDNAATKGLIMGNGTASGTGTVNVYLPASTIERNRLAQHPVSGRIGNNLYYDSAEALKAEYMHWTGYHDLRLKPTARAT